MWSCCGLPHSAVRPPVSSTLQEVGEAKKVMGPEALLREKIKQRRHREGYEDGLSTSHKVTRAANRQFCTEGNEVDAWHSYSQAEQDAAGVRVDK